MKHAHIVSARIDSGFNTVQNHTVNTDVCCFIMKSQMALKNCDLNQPSQSQVESEDLDTNKHKNEKIQCDLDPLREHEKRNDPTVELTQMKENITTHETNERKCHDLQDAGEGTNNIKHQNK